MKNATLTRELIPVSEEELDLAYGGLFTPSCGQCLACKGQKIGSCCRNDCVFGIFGSWIKYEY